MSEYKCNPFGFMFDDCSIHGKDGSLWKEQKKLQESAKQANTLQAQYEELKASEKIISDAYLRVRTLMNSFDTNFAGENRFEVTENKIKELKADRERFEVVQLNNWEICPARHGTWVVLKYNGIDANKEVGRGNSIRQAIDAACSTIKGVKEI